ncbi:hypothetical protein COV53_06925 [Candidatus Gottesmanbacteria bacterium CG11_big_fil_rev_8_21_14_0_20_37_11]|uniref:Polymerase nucleotidyl transferase domain-containing protein n=3 Tax=Candidatus Gottesmaniibacteriota TaxID=1752720 RepID=A0A2M7RSC0_9BACT|nr:MAG: hypothetical protein AUJ73_00145 [Candidatus Gottesmanbacteria bacterium CG1_02_37_22]PIR07690.1 MAG: hypothetical protein COV53_06925 [Candidatus Gottesmanbacteria bacterium CG11_big_fil_rev_8_21_14_0_20_37_11]PIZ03221.1 MAG: hypothetical protein COY59_00680 [Candidatus Gottesmanbacteria bacterium CG_4_10_14_0_8_um_filter_37_24]
MSLIYKAILKTVIYADIFDYPLTYEEIQRYLIEIDLKKRENKYLLNENKFISLLESHKEIERKEGFYFLKGRNQLIPIRKRRKIYSEEKITILKNLLKNLRHVKTIKMVGVTGSLAVDNADKEDDIDILIVTSQGLLWWTRLITTLITEITGKRRHPNDIDLKGKFCLNMFIDTNNLSVPECERNIYTAHEVAQMVPIHDLENTYELFINKNIWVKNYLPNAFDNKKSANIKKNPGTTNLTCVFEYIIKHLQLLYMRRHRTVEVIRDGMIRFHVYDHGTEIIKAYQDRLMKYKI